MVSSVPLWEAIVAYLVGLISGAAITLHLVSFWREHRRWQDTDRKWVAFSQWYEHNEGAPKDALEAMIEEIRP